jgi:hypothetical protein
VLSMISTRRVIISQLPISNCQLPMRTLNHALHAADVEHSDPRSLIPPPQPTARSRTMGLQLPGGSSWLHAEVFVWFCR